MRAFPRLTPGSPVRGPLLLSDSRLRFAGQQSQLPGGPRPSTPCAAHHTLCFRKTSARDLAKFVTWASLHPDTQQQSWPSSPGAAVHHACPPHPLSSPQQPPLAPKHKAPPTSLNTIILQTPSLVPRSRAQKFLKNSVTARTRSAYTLRPRS